MALCLSVLKVTQASSLISKQDACCTLFFSCLCAFVREYVLLFEIAPIITPAAKFISGRWIFLVGYWIFGFGFRQANAWLLSARGGLDCGDPAPLWLCCKTSVSRHRWNMWPIPNPKRRRGAALQRLLRNHKRHKKHSNFCFKNYDF